MSGRTDAAIRRLLAWQPATPAEAEQRLWGLAVIYRQTGRPQEALPHLEQLVALRPDVGDFRDALAQVRQDLGQTAPPPSDVPDGAVALGGDWSGHLRLSFIPATNAAEGTRAETIIIGGRRFVIGAGSRQRRAYGVAIGAGLAFSPAIGERTRLRFGLSVDADIYDGNAYDDIRLRGETVLVHSLSARTTVEGGITYSRRWLDGAGYSKGPGLTFGLTTQPSDRSLLQIAGAVDWLSFDGVTGLDGPRALATVRYAYAVSPRMHLRTSATVERTDADVASFSYTALQIGIGGTYAFENGLRTGVDLSVRRAAYDAASAFFGTTRKDDRFTASVSFSHPSVQYMGFQPELEITYTTQSSNIPLYSFDNLGANLGIVRRF
ncbi:hypothetical protein ATO6_08070 [Oceanicola sp. 22II-s10i]|nr:hypothetical protein ATO6_08070 [Oceanicola sp. 22II-s10i]